MGVKKIEKQGNKLRIELEIEISPDSMLKSEENIETVLNATGVAASELALSEFDTDGSPIELEGTVLISKGQQKK
ncbi:MAG: hypothetical protein AAF847_11035 [Bacteroidota bacterium]